MAKDPAKPSGTEQYSEVVSRLQGLVEQLESGGLSLEDSLERFAEGIQLVRRGEQLLSAAEKRIEQLLSDDKVAPLEVPETAAAAPEKKPAPAQQQQQQARPPPQRNPREDDDVPF